MAKGEAFQAVATVNIVNSMKKPQESYSCTSTPPLRQAAEAVLSSLLPDQPEITVWEFCEAKVGLPHCNMLSTNLEEMNALVPKALGHVARVGNQLKCYQPFLITPILNAPWLMNWLAAVLSYVGLSASDIKAAPYNSCQPGRSQSCRQSTGCWPGFE